MINETTQATQATQTPFKRATEATKEMAVAGQGAKNISAMLPKGAQWDDGFTAPANEDYLPFLEFIFPIMQTPNSPWYKGKEYTLGFKQGQEFISLPKGTILTVVDRRNSARVKEIKADGNTKNVYSYAAIERGGVTYDKTNGDYLNAVAEGTADEGYSMVLVALMPLAKGETEADRRQILLDLSAYKTLTSYLYTPLAGALLTNRRGVRIDIEDHTPNLVKSAAGFYYPSGKNFKAWEEVQLSDEQVLAIVTLLQEKQNTYLNWLNK